MKARTIITLAVILVLIVVFLVLDSSNDQVEVSSNENENNRTQENLDGNLEAEVDDSRNNQVLSLLVNDPNTQTATLNPVDGSESSGIGYRLVRGGSLFHAVVATLPDPSAVTVYEGWLVQPSPLKFFSTGVMQEVEDNVWTLEYKSEDEYPTHTRVVITQETVLDATPERHVIEGDF